MVMFSLKNFVPFVSVNTLNAFVSYLNKWHMYQFKNEILVSTVWSFFLCYDVMSNSDHMTEFISFTNGRLVIFDFHLNWEVFIKLVIYMQYPEHIFPGKEILKVINFTAHAAILLNFHPQHKKQISRLLWCYQFTP